MGLLTGQSQNGKRGYKQKDMIQRQWQQVWDNVSKLFFPHSHASPVSGYSLWWLCTCKPVLTYYTNTKCHTWDQTSTNLLTDTHKHTYRNSEIEGTYSIHCTLMQNSCSFIAYITLYCYHLNTGTLAVSTKSSYCNGKYAPDSEWKDLCSICSICIYYSYFADVLVN